LFCGGYAATGAEAHRRKNAQQFKNNRNKLKNIQKKWARPPP
jgi:hypothetical protein